MGTYSWCVALLCGTLQIWNVYAQEDIIKSSLTFVIDDTASMWNEIDQVKQEANEIFDKVLSSNASQIENFVLVTFNDPDAELRTITKDRDEFKKALAVISVHGGGDCPEYAMKGIEVALVNSLPLSYIYVFTDASAKDFTQFELIKSLSHQKQSQVVFILTGQCRDDDDPAYQVYHKVAEATSGQVFHMMKDDVQDILKYVEETITARTVTLLNKKLEPGYGKLITYPVDSYTGDVLISVTGKKAKIGTVTGPGGSKPKTDHIVSKPDIAIVKVPGEHAEVGDYEVEVGSKSETHAVITAKTNINFHLRFSPFKPTSIKDTATRPTPDGDTFLSVKLIGEGVRLENTNILDINGNIITKLPLELVDEKEQFYVTPSFDAPTTLFRVAVTGHDVNTKTPVTRESPTPIQRQNKAIVKTTYLAPEITIDGAPKLITEYGGPLQLKCKVHGYPKSEIIWEEKGSGISLPAKESLIEVPYDYISILDIEKANANVTYQCKASNPYGVSIKYVAVETKRRTYFDVIETPKDIRIEYNKTGSITCKVNAHPPASITWYKDGKSLSSEMEHFEFSSDMMTLTIKQMQLELQGMYICETRNEFERRLFHSKVFIFGLEKPIIDKTDEEIYISEKTEAELSCRVLRGIPKPTISWYFRHINEEKFSKLEDTSEVINLRNVGKDMTGSYKCIARNFAGSDRFIIDLNVEYKPIIKDGDKILRVKDNSEVKIPCDVEGAPEPVVTWFYNDTVLENTEKTHIANDHSLKFRATISDAGFYSCEAENSEGKVKKVVFVDVFAPVYIDIPKVTSIKTMVGKNEILPCVADGYPAPKIQWIFHSFDEEAPPKDVTPRDGSVSIILQKVQLNQQGYYTCIADNSVGGSANITYEVQVYAPPIIENVYLDKTFEAVKGDLSLKIQCKATGSPKPTITWKKNDLNLALGSEWYDLEEDGTLLFKNIDSHSAGTYVCVAENHLGKAIEMYDVVVRDYPKERPTSSVLVEIGKSVDIKCDLPHKNTDQLRWYKNGMMIARGELILNDAVRTDDGVYTCRVNDLTKSRSASTNVIVGSKPEFINTVEEIIEFIPEADDIPLDCEAIGQPTPKVSWKHNGKEMDATDMMYLLKMTFSNRGTYSCEVTNEFGSIHRSFNIISRDCILDVKKDFPSQQPVMFSRSLTWPTFEVTDGYMMIPHRDYFFLYCPNKFSNLPKKILMVYCEGDATVKINGMTYNFADIKCTEDVKHQSLRTGQKCLPGNTEKIQIGYTLHKQFLKAYDVCLDKDNNVTLFSQHKLSPTYTDSSTESKWFNDILPQDFNRMYDCKTQVPDIESGLRRTLRTGDSCCFAKRQLINSRDLVPGIPTSAAFNYLNAIPHWSSCNSKNWDEVEKRVRNLAKTAARDLIVRTGTANRHDVRPSVSPTITLSDGRGGKQPVAQYLWKIVQDPPSSASLAIIHVNIPELSPRDAHRHILCPNICSRTTWMANPNWLNVKDGLTYCCKITDFELVFGYYKRFSTGMNKVLLDVSAIPEFYLTI